MTDLLNISLSGKLINYSEIDKLKEDKWIKYIEFCSWFAFFASKSSVVIKNTSAQGKVNPVIQNMQSQSVF